MEIPYGFCHCGCGHPAPIIRKTKLRIGHVKGQFARYIHGHHSFLYPQNHKVEDRGYETPCWIWQGCIDENGYGRSGHLGRTTHRQAYEKIYGPVPPGMELDHLCKQRACRNPDHLECVTHRVNVRRSSTTKLTEESVREMRRLHNSGITYVRLAERFSISLTLVRQVMQRRRWVDVK